MHSSKILPNKTKGSSAPKFKNLASSSSKAAHQNEIFSKPSPQKKDPTVTNKRNSIGLEQTHKFTLDEVPQFKDKLQIAPSNKIYHKKVLGKQGEYLNKSTFINIQKCQKQEERQSRGHLFAGTRPQSSNPEKNPHKFEVQGFNKQKLIPQLRPGSSKSSRLFKKKSIVIEDSLQTQNGDTSDVFININPRQNNNENTLSLRERHRIGTSISNKKRGLDKFQTKLDPMFFNLFAS